MILNRTSLLGMAYVAVFPALLAYHFWSLGVAAVGAARAGAIGMALIVAGVAIATRKL
jgi:hypothetical protein